MRRCDRCGTYRHYADLGTITSDGVTRYYCHPAMSSGETCYSVASAPSDVRLRLAYAANDLRDMAYRREGSAPG